MQQIQRFQPIKWWLWIAVILSLPCGAGIWGVTQLMHLPELPDCLSEFWSKDSTATVFYCATTFALEQDANKLYKAIELVNAIPADHPQRQMSDRMIEQWSQALLNLGENTFQQGNIDKAVNIAKMIPDNVSAHQLANNRIKQWKSIWSKAENIYKTASNHVTDEDERDNSYVALTEAKKLLRVGNEFWATTKYQELVHHIQDIKEKKEEPKAQKENRIETTKIPETLNPWDKEQETQDIAQLTKARQLANSEKIENLREAISEASMVVSNRYYEEAQKFIATTRSQIDIADDRYSLQQANELASNNDVLSLQMAINEASLISKERPLYQEANEHIEQWKGKILKLEKESKFKRINKSPSKNLQINNSLDNQQLNTQTTISELEDQYLQSVEP